MTPDQFVSALGLTESDANPEAWGDTSGGTRPPLAMGRWQIHPAWLWDHTADAAAKPNVLESWDTWIGRLISMFAAKWLPSLPPVEIAMWFHVGHRIQQSETDWDAQYAERFQKAAASVA